MEFRETADAFRALRHALENYPLADQYRAKAGHKLSESCTGYLEGIERGAEADLNWLLSVVAFSGEVRGSTSPLIDRAGVNKHGHSNADYQLTIVLHASDVLNSAASVAVIKLIETRMETARDLAARYRVA